MPFQQNTHYYINDLVQSSMLQIDRDIQRPEKYKQNFGVSSEASTNLPTKRPSSKRRSSPCILQVVVSLSLGSFLYSHYLSTGTYQIQSSKNLTHKTQMYTLRDILYCQTPKVFILVKGYSTLMGQRDYISCSCLF
jgi:hypothetical protein